ncbi:MAG: formimidoylglutamate deiminase [Pseudomonadota bacterium]
MLWFERALLPSGWARRVRLTVADGLIVSVTTDADPASGDQRHGIALPGLPNLHSHAFQRGMAGLAERRGPSSDSFWSWRETMYRFVDRIGPDDLAAIAAMAFVEMLEGGFTRVGEFHYLHHASDGTPYADRAEMAAALVRAANEAGIALTLLPVFYAHGGFGGQPPGEGQRRFLNDRDGFAALLDASHGAVRGLPDAVVGVAPHSLRAVTPADLAALVPLAGGGPVHIHIAEQEREVADCIAWSGARPVEWLLDNAPVGPAWCAVHATHMTADETQRLAASSAVAGLCPITEANLGDGIFPAQEFLAAGGRYGIGSDSNVLISAAEELRLLEYGQRLSRRSRNVLADAGGSTGAALFAGALVGGAQALGAPAGLVPGHPADLFSLAAAHPTLAVHDGDAILDAFVFAGTPVDRVWRRGVELVCGGRHHARDGIAARYRERMARWRD